MLQVAGLVVRYGAITALDGVDLEVPDGRVGAVLGPSGCGKTTLLRVIAGLERPDEGTVSWDGSDLAPVPAHRRGFGLMFQDFALFPNRDVAGNVEFGLRMQGLDAAERSHKVGKALAMVGLEGYDHRPVGKLSGGEAQRVALARALAPEPRLLMLDEPLGSLDRALRQRLLGDLDELLGRLGMTALYVTHDQEEALAIADRVIVMRAGRAVQAGAPDELWHRPNSEYVARFLGFSNIADAVLENGSAQTEWGTLPVPAGLSGKRRVVVRPDGLVPVDDGPIAGTVETQTFRGDHYVVRVKPEHGPVLEASLRHRVRPGDPIRLAVDPSGVVVLEPEST